MSLSLTQNFYAIAPQFNSAQFVAVNGTPPYVYSVIPNGSGGTINSSTGVYIPANPFTAYPASKLYDTILVKDSLKATATSQILVGSVFFLVLDILQRQLSIPNDHIFLWDQKVFQPTDSNPYYILSVPSVKPFGNVNTPNPSNGSIVNQYVAMYAKIDIDVISRGPQARDQIGLIPIVLNSIYAQQQQEAMGFYISKLPTGVLNLSNVDGAAIPYRFKYSFAVQYQTNLSASVPFYSTFQTVGVDVNP